MFEMFDSQLPENDSPNKATHRVRETNERQLHRLHLLSYITALLGINNNLIHCCICFSIAMKRKEVLLDHNMNKIKNDKFNYHRLM